MGSRKVILSTVVVAGFIAAGIGGGTASAAAPADLNAAVVHQSNQSVREVQQYWTPARMKAAKAPAQPAVTAALSAVPAQSHKLPAVSAPGALPVKAAGLTSDALINPAAVTQSGVWTAHGSMPATTVGKLYFTTPAGPSECSASVINSQNRSMIWTAGHCVTDGAQHWYSTFKFVPDYHDGISPLGSWVWKSVSAPTAYFNGANRDFDLAAISLWPQNGVKVADRTGYQGYKFNQGYTWYAYEFGYPYDTHPARAGINGQQLRYCISWTWQAGNRQAIHCDQGHGASGGPWLDDLQLSRGWGYLIGNVSYHPSESSDEERGPHFGDAAVNVYNAQTNA